MAEPPTPQEINEQELRDLAAKNRLCCGSTYMIDCESGVVSCAMVWANGGIADVEHFAPDHHRYRRELEWAGHRRETIYRKKPQPKEGV